MPAFFVRCLFIFSYLLEAESSNRLRNFFMAQSTNATPKKKRADIWKPIFIDTLRNSACVWAACQVARIERSTAYRARDKDEKFRKAWNDALEDACDQLEYALRRRALAEDTTAAIFLLKAHRPEKFRETVRQEVTGANGGAIEIKNAASDFDSRMAALIARITAQPVSSDPDAER